MITETYSINDDDKTPGQIAYEAYQKWLVENCGESYRSPDWGFDTMSANIMAAYEAAGKAVVEWVIGPDPTEEQEIVKK